MEGVGHDKIQTCLFVYRSSFPSSQKVNKFNIIIVTDAGKGQKNQYWVSK
ncbi:hypothetical protein C943_02330 [Mariniradius saccharolyticus AK6]|uniref:Uncharacterized protein n=1 Tax=Mariniradius saccharolyticus AK6 TaxID=1239962 RepID=M7X8Y9_9BACT|nr:hypothetical protein C943_02330 [Mariniradius saccharolyticus AK6]